MARRKRSGPAEDLVELVAMLPWWVGVALAPVSYVLLHQIAAQSLTVGAPSGRAGMAVQALWMGLASAGQYILPFICVVAAGVSAWRRKVRQGLVTDVAQSQATDALDGMSWREFELLVGEGFRLQGYQVAETGGGGADGGVDLVLTRPGKGGGEKFLVQCKQWRALKVGVDVVRELYGVMAARGATGGFVVTSGRFTDDAIRFASGRNVRLVDGPKLLGLIRQAKSAAGQPTPSRGASQVVPLPTEAGQAIVCPVCAKPMVRRTAKRGAQAGRDFWGCTGYPDCRGTRSIA
ncbi:MAG: restriction endonuclease [Burkholderiales bacterium]|nr:restriction endonuclease [Burkholderiales bacterium]